MKSTSIFFLITSTFFALSTSASPPAPKTYHLDSAPAKGPSTVETTLPSLNTLDGVKVNPVNATTYEWWYFDAISSALSDGDLSSISIVFYDATAGGFEPLGQGKSKLVAQLGGTFANGSAIIPEAYTLSTYAEEATVAAEGQGSVGSWGKYGGWWGSPDGKEWEVRFEDRGKGIKGSLRLESVAPPHLPCGAPEVGATEILLPGVEWAVAVPDAIATVDFDIGGSRLQFSGVGYHDKNWGSVPLFEAISSWYWGHAHLGPYSIVWLDTLSQAGAEYFSAYVAKDSQVLTSSCSKGAVTARPWGGEDTYPPPHNNKVPKGFEIVFADVEGDELRVNVTIADVTLPALNVYDRFIGSAQGQFSGQEETWSGVACFEQFKF